MKNSKLSARKICNIDLFTILSTVILFCSIIFLNYHFPKTCDDITFSLIIDMPFKNLLNLALNQGNGRLLGNFFSYLIKYTWFTVIEKTCIWTGIIFLIIQLVGSKNRIVNTLIAVIMIYPCDSIFAQVYSWNAGFQNYAFPVFIILFDMFLFKNTHRIKSRLNAVFTMILLFITAFAGQFFSENSSLFAVCLAIVILICCITEKSGIQYAITYLIATLGGFILMMTYPHILGTSAKISSYRQHADSLETLFALVLKNFRLTAKDFAGYALLWIIVSAAFFVLIRNVLDKVYSNKVWKIVLSVSKIIICAYPAFSLVYSFIAKTPIAFPRYYFSHALCISLSLYVAALLTVSFMLLAGKGIEKNDKLPALLIILACLSYAPLLIVSPIGARTFYIPFVCLFLSGMTGLKSTLEKIKVDTTVSFVCVAVLCCVLSVLGMAERDNSYCYQVRENYLSQEIKKGSESVILPLLPHQNLVQDDTNRGAWTNYIKKKYGKEIEYNFMEWNKWYTDYYRNSK